MNWLSAAFGKTSFFAHKALAASGDPGTTVSVTWVGPKNFEELWNLLMKGVLWAAVPITTAMVLWGAFQILTAGGDPEKVKSGGKTVLYAAMGFGLVLIAQGMTLLIQDILK